MQTINHQFSSESFYIPNWEVQHLFVGTFNPEGGARVPYYYGREKNQLWPLLSEIFHAEFNPSSDNFWELLRRHKIACIDMIHSVTASEEHIDAIIGKGYKDSEIINRAVARTYNTSSIIQLIAKNHGIRVYSTWGNGSSLREWRAEVQQLGALIPLVSPSLAARVPKGEAKYNYLFSDWLNKVGQLTVNSQFEPFYIKS